jgi:hypothetical protein
MLRTECDSYGDKIAAMEDEVQAMKDDNERIGVKYLKYKKKLRKLEKIAGIINSDSE